MEIIPKADSNRLVFALQFLIPIFERLFPLRILDVIFFVDPSAMDFDYIGIGSGKNKAEKSLISPPMRTNMRVNEHYMPSILKNQVQKVTICFHSSLNLN